MFRNQGCQDQVARGSLIQPKHPIICLLHLYVGTDVYDAHYDACAQEKAEDVEAGQNCWWVGRGGEDM